MSGVSRGIESADDVNSYGSYLVLTLFIAWGEWLLRRTMGQTSPGSPSSSRCDDHTYRISNRDRSGITGGHCLDDLQ
jgi:hypothetical protein